MNTLIDNISNIIIIKKSEFITKLYKVYNIENTKIILEKLKKEYPDSNHICYAYIIDNQKRFSDDNEPNNTAGKPILEVLEKKQMNYILAVVIRYFGGIKLGSNGLIRAYSNSVNSLLTKENIKSIEYGYIIAINDFYNKEEIINYLLRDSKIIKKEYTDKIYIEAIIKKEILEKLSNISYKIIDEIIL